MRSLTFAGSDMASVLPRDPSQVVSLHVPEMGEDSDEVMAVVSYNGGFRRVKANSADGPFDINMRPVTCDMIRMVSSIAGMCTVTMNMNSRGDLAMRINGAIPVGKSIIESDENSKGK
jgi:hypothetical protein